MTRPSVPPLFLDTNKDLLAPSEEMEAWARSTFIEGEGPLVNPDHDHLRHAVIGFVWTNVTNARHQRRVVGTAELGLGGGMAGRWVKGRAEFLLRLWFGEVPDFLITLDAVFMSTANDATFCAVVEHELYHCSQKRNRFGFPLRNKRTRRPMFEIRGHDVEQFVGVVRRYGARASNVEELVEAAKGKPLFDGVVEPFHCGNCLPVKHG